MEGRLVGAGGKGKPGKTVEGKGGGVGGRRREGWRSLEEKRVWLEEREEILKGVRPVGGKDGAWRLCAMWN